MATHAYCERVVRAPGSGSLCTAAAAGDVVIQVVLPGPGDRRAVSSVEAGGLGLGLGQGTVSSDVDPASSTSGVTGEEAEASAAAAAAASAAEEEDEPINLAQYLSELGDEHGEPYHDHLFFGDPEMALSSAASAAHSAFPTAFSRSLPRTTSIFTHARDLTKPELYSTPSVCTCTCVGVRDLVRVRPDAPVAAARAMLSRLAPAAMAAIKRAEDAEAVAAAATGSVMLSSGSSMKSHVDAADYNQTDICDAAHGNLVPVKGVFEGADGALYIMFPAPPGTLQVRACVHLVYDTRPGRVNEFGEGWGGS